LFYLQPLAALSDFGNQPRLGRVLVEVGERLFEIGGQQFMAGSGGVFVQVAERPYG